MSVATEDVPDFDVMSHVQAPDHHRRIQGSLKFDLDGLVEDNVAYLYEEVQFLPTKVKQ